MKFILGLFITSILSSTAVANSMVNVANCNSSPGEEYLRSGEFSWGMTLSEIKNKERDIYDRGLRLKERAMLKDGQVVLPYYSFGDDEPKYIKLTDQFIASVVSHVENALKRNYVDAIIFPDMGHSHLFLDKKYYEEVLKDIPVKEQHKRYELMFAHPKTKFLYHTAEQLKVKEDSGELIDDRHLQWRFFTRNIVGDNQAGKLEIIHNESHSHNTARTYEEGYRYWGAGFNISATKNGCFAYKKDGKTYYFDLSLKDLEP